MHLSSHYSDAVDSYGNPETIDWYSVLVVVQKQPTGNMEDGKMYTKKMTVLHHSASYDTIPEKVHSYVLFYEQLARSVGTCFVVTFCLRSGMENFDIFATHSQKLQV